MCVCDFKSTHILSVNLAVIIQAVGQDLCLDDLVDDIGDLEMLALILELQHVQACVCGGRRRVASSGRRGQTNKPS